MDKVEITDDEIDVNAALKNLSNPECGATVFFLGTTRDNFNGKKVVELHYEAYTPMAKSEMLKILHTMKTEYNVRNVVLIHRLGHVSVCEASVLVAASSAHRKEALEAVSYAIDAIKLKVPIWKKEMYEDGTSNWKENARC
ncbi:molybdopterin synthase catalytic subunit-like [Uloborus diversus]|uniref:molybdopterin synthase catalytic subunit-like n=1 Tax=Uloborus diversus TaxID=327109 RepID=UPI00240A596C|nr:molybdopterin synthase catalytic subunit-like [Uloborus diversus]